MEKKGSNDQKLGCRQEENICMGISYTSSVKLIGRPKELLAFYKYVKLKFHRSSIKATTDNIAIYKTCKTCKSFEDFRFS